jgi:hypothetical protein
MNLKLTHLHTLENNANLKGSFKSGVSLHCHTQHSREMLDFVPHYAQKLPIINWFWAWESKRYVEKYGKSMDFSEAHWTPPLTALQVYDIECAQIQDQIGLDAIVSLTDHDEIAANQKLRAERDDAKAAPISLEWTVPFDFGFFHLGIHNLPAERADAITKDLLDFTFAEKRGLTFGENRLDELFAMLNEIPEVLVVFNHPIWDIEMVGKERHQVLLDAFIVKHGRWIHAFEINGFRTWSENKAVLEMADALGFPVVSGGDRHGCQPNSVVNLSASNTFSEFAEQIRHDKFSQVILMPHYYQPLAWRQMESFSEILKHYPEFPEDRQKWIQRVFVQIDERGINPLSLFWKRGGPKWLRVANWTLSALGHNTMRPVFSALRSKKDVVPASFTFPAAQKFKDESAAPDLKSKIA